jgi:hypothetical protein
MNIPVQYGECFRSLETGATAGTEPDDRTVRTVFQTVFHMISQAEAAPQLRCD